MFLPAEAQPRRVALTPPQPTPGSSSGLRFLVDLNRGPPGGRHRMPGQRMGRLLRLARLHLPGWPFVFAEGSGFGTRGMARFGPRHRGRRTR